MPENQVSPDAYKAIFEDHRVGAAIFEDLLKKFGRLPTKDGGIDRVLNQFEYAGQRRVLDFIVLKINQANGVEPKGGTVELDEG